MTQVINTGGGDSSAGIVVGIILAIVVVALVYFLVIRDGDIDFRTNTPDINITIPEAPALPEAPAAPRNDN